MNKFCKFKPRENKLALKKVMQPTNGREQENLVFSDYIMTGQQDGSYYLNTQGGYYYIT